MLKFIPTFLRKLLFRGHAIHQYEKAVQMAEDAHAADPNGRRYFVFGTKHGDLKVTTADEEIRDRRRDHRVLKPDIFSPYVLRKQAFYFTPSKLCKKKYNPDRMQDFEKEVHRQQFIDWYFSMC